MSWALFRTGWRSIAHRNALSSSNIAALRTALSEPGPLSVVFGWHYYYAGGCSRTEIVTRSADDVLAEIEASKPGDHFTLYDLAHIAHLADHHVTLMPGDQELLAEVIEAAAQLSRENEVVAVFAGPTSTLHTLWNLDDQDLQEIRDAWHNAGTGDLLFFRSDILDQDAMGQPITSVSLPTGRRRIYALLDAKRPTSAGRTPAHGPY